MARIRPLRPNGGNNNNSRNPLLDNEDLAMRANDARLADVENRLARLYGDAADNLTSQLDEYLERYTERDEEMRLRVESGEITQTEYIAWRNRVILRQHQMEQQIESLTNDMVNADQLAVQMVNGELPDVYVSSYNYSGFRGEVLADAAGYSYNSFTLYNADAIRIIVAEDPDLIPWEEPSVDIPRDMRWNRSHIQNAIAQGILQGDSIAEISARLLPIVHMDEVAATRTARTSFTAVQNQARRDGVARLRANGIPMVEPWMSVLANNTRDTHLQLHGTYPNEQGLYGEGIIASGNLLRFPGDPHGDPEQIYNCQCRVQSYIEGIDHSRDAELYAQMMRQEHYDDWVGRREGYDINGVRDYKVEEQRQALERRRALNEGEIENRENRYRMRRMEREGVAPVQSSIIYDDAFNGNKWDSTKSIIDNLANEYNTRLITVKPGAEKGAGDVDMSGATMRINTTQPATSIHEFAHTLANSSADKYGLTHDGDFWREIRKIRNAYHRDVDKTQNSSRWISSYEHSSNSIDEFLAEAFTQAKMHEMALPIPDKYGNDFTYSEQVLAIINKYFRKK